MTAAKPYPEGHYATLPNGYRLHYLEQGAEQAGAPVVVFLHGSGSGASGHSNFKRNYPVLAQAGYRVIVPDLIGYGYSDKPDDVNYPLSFFVECVHQLLQAIGVQRFTLIGNSLGGAIALQYTLDYPQTVERLLLMAPGGIENQADYFTMPGMQIMKEVFTGPPTRDSLEQFIRRGLVYDESQVDEELVNERWAVFQTQNTQVIKTMTVPNLTDRLPEITCPVLVLWGVNENMMPESGIQKLAKGLPRVRVTLVSQCGHWVMFEHPEFFNRTTLDFLAND